MRTRTRLAALSLFALLAAGTLSGCGALHPGIAAEVGDESISDSEVDSIAVDFCTALRSSPRTLGTGYARSTLMQFVVRGFVMRAMAGQLAEQYDVSSTEDYKTAIAQTKLQFTTLDPDVLDNILDTWNSSTYFLDLLGQVGTKELTAKGVASPTAEAALAEGISVAQAWEKEHDITIDPRFPGLTLSAKNFTVIPDETSFAVSDFAKKAAADPPDAAWIKTLPASQRCD